MVFVKMATVVLSGVGAVYLTPTVQEDPRPHLRLNHLQPRRQLILLNQRQLHRQLEFRMETLV